MITTYWEADGVKCGGIWRRDIIGATKEYIGWRENWALNIWLGVDV